MPSSLEGSRVVVTGAASGIGRATALRLLRDGASVVASDVNDSGLAALNDEVAAATLRTVPGDITDTATVDRVVAAAAGRIDGLANVAGIMDGFLPTAEIDDDTWDRVLRVNLTGPMRLTRAVLPLMLDAGRGAIVNVTSEAGLRGSAAGVAYTASKHGLAGYTKNVAFMYGPQGIRANAVAPGAVMTNVEGSMRSQLAAERVGPIMAAAMPSPARPEQLASVITWLLNDDSSNVNGAVLPSDGGWSAV